MNTADSKSEEHSTLVMRELVVEGLPGIWLHMRGPSDYTTLSVTVTPRTFQEVLFLKVALDLTNNADAVTAAVRLATFLVGEVQRGTTIFLESPSGAISHLNTDGWPTQV
ncbi:MAG TPA: hypothetical protein VF173_35785 [Thermoanaerobaculia bacterium]|nr:hypothetical protein [Thermoanaerobaculia bacterium]